MAETGLNSTAAAILGLLHDGPMTGGELVAAAEARLGSFWTVTRSQVYRELPMLAERGFVRLGKAGPRASQPYAITPVGKRAFGRWLSEAPGRDHHRNQLLLRASFGRHHSAGQLRELLAAQREQHEQRLADLRERLKSADDPYIRATLEFAVTYERALVRWIDQVAKS